MNKKANVTDIAFMIGTLLFVAFFCFVAYYVFNQVSDRMLLNPIMNSTQGSVAALQSIETTSNKFDYFVLMVFIGLTLAIIITSWFLGGNQLFIVLYFLVMIILIIISMVVSNVWENVTQASVWSTTINAFPIANNLLTYLPIYIAIVGFLGIVAMFGKPFIGGGGGDGY